VLVVADRIQHAVALAFAQHLRERDLVGHAWW